MFGMERLRGKSCLRWRDRRVSLPGGATGLWLVLFWLAAAPMHAASFTASLDNDTLTLGQSTTLSLTFEGGSPRNVPTPSVPGLQISQAGTSQNVSWVNGAMSATVTVAFSVTPQRLGDFVIPAIAADVNGQKLTSPPLQLRVLKPSAPAAVQINSDSQIAFARLSLPEDKVYNGEAVVADLSIYFRQDTQLVRRPQLTGVQADGFTVGKIAANGQGQVQVGNAIYNVINAQIALTANKAGPLRVGPVNVALVLAVPSDNRSSDPFLQQFRQLGFPVRDFGEEQKQFSVATEIVNAQSLPLPTQNVPPNFNGAIGQYTMAVTAGPTNVAVGDPITIHVQISGRGDLGSLALPDQSAWHNFTIYPPTSRLETTDPLGMQSTKTFEEIVSPQNVDVHELPSFSFSYFDPDTGSYHTLAEPPVALAVRSAGATPVPAIAAGQTAGPQSPARPEDILPIKDDLGALARAGSPWITRPAFLALQTVPVLAFLATFIWRRRADSLANNPRLRRQRAVAAVIASGRDDLKKYAAENRPDEFFATLFRLLQEQLGERLDCPASAITESVVDERLAALGAPEPVLNGLREVFQLCNQARYAPIRGSAELNSVVGQFEKVIAELRELKV